MRRKIWSSSGLAVFVIVVAALLFAPGVPGVAIQGIARLPSLEDPASRLTAMVNAGISPSSSVVAAADSGIRVGRNVQVFDNRQPQNEISVAANPADGGNLVIGSNDYRLRGQGGSVWVGVYTSKDAGKSWLTQLLPGYPTGPTGVLSTYQFGGDPIVGFDASGHAYAGGIFFRGTRTGNDIKDVSIYVSRSDDGGVTWNEPVLVALGKGQSPFHDHPQMAVDATGGANDGNVYVSWTRFGGVGQIDIYVATSRDHGASWSALQVSGPIPQGDAEGFYQDSMAAIGPNGEVYVVWDETFLENGAIPRMHLWMSVSLDGGRTFASPWIADADVVPIFLPNASYRYGSYPAAAVDTTTGAHRGRLYLSWADSRNGNADILLKASDDGGMTWGPIVRVNDDASHAAQFFHWITVGPDGRVDLSFYDRRDDPNDYLLNEYAARSIDGGATFANVRVSSVSSDPAVWPSFIGDYNQIASTDRASYPAWSDMRNGLPGNFNQDVYTAAVFA